jgi:hypothetical protein
VACGECFSRTIFYSIDHLRQEIWRFLFCYGQSQGLYLYPHQSLNMHFPPSFTCYLCSFFHVANVADQVTQVREMKRHLDAKLMYRMVSISDSYKLYSLDSPELIQQFTKLIGASSFLGIRRPKPKLGGAVTTKMNDAMNVLSKVYLYIGYSNVRLWLHAYQHIVGIDAHNNIPLISCIPREALPRPEVISELPSGVLRINSKFDYQGNVCKVVSVNSNGSVCTCSLWGPQKGDEIIFNSVREVLQLVNAKRG